MLIGATMMELIYAWGFGASLFAMPGIFLLSALYSGASPSAGEEIGPALPGND